PTTSSWNLSVQRQAGSAWLASASYIGNSASHVWAQKQLNPAVYFPGGPCTLNGVTYNTCSSTTNTNQRRRFILEKPAEGGLLGLVGEIDAGATANYHAMLLSLQRQAGRGVTVSGNYTWSHCIGDYADLNSIGPDQAETYTDPNNRRFDRGNCNSDRRHIVNLTSVAETPQFSNATLRMLATGWRLSGIYKWSSGQPFTVINGSDRALTGIDNQRANQVLASPYLDRSGRPLSQFLNPAAFKFPALGASGNMGRGNIQGPSAWSFDIALSRAFQMGEGKRFEVRAEAYNVTNSFRPAFTTTGASLLGLSLASNTFGQVRSSLDPRLMQFAVKYVF
ncbi:MAG: TonB-dependent receptor, partial [Acidobacteria bacterium]